nr:MAG TPA: hypothetical protein [Caudoviricetes sp.]
MTTGILFSIIAMRDSNAIVNIAFRALMKTYAIM